MDSKPHQAHCVDWCLKCEANNHGGLIADEMGLGKTIQIIALLHANPQPNTLIVVPVALLDQWYDTLNTLSSSPTIQTHLNPILYHGSKRKHQLSKVVSLSPNTVTITTYGEISRTRSRTNRTPASPLHDIKWSRVVFDEAHHLRNPNTNTHRASLQLSAKVKWLLTGTPIQNSRRDFDSLCAVIGVPRNLELKQLARTYLLKRTKKQLAIPMPELNEETIQVSWDTNQAEQVVAQQLHQRVGFQETDTATRITNIRIPECASGSRLVEYLRARQICVLPELLKGKFHTDQPDEAPTFAQATPIATDTFLETATSSSSKIDAVVAHIKEHAGRKIVFCEFHKEMDAIEQRLTTTQQQTHPKCLRLVVGRIDGTTPPELRKAILRSHLIDVLLLQIRTCSEGLNLQDYTSIYINTPQWNPCVESQAIARAYRIGQTKPVNVYRFIMDSRSLGLTETMEMRVMERQQMKIEQAKIIDTA